MATISLALEGAPFSPPQRNWLNDFLAGVLGLDRSHDTAPPRHVVTQHPVVIDRQHPLEATVLAARTLTHQSSTKDVRFLAFDLEGSGLRYRAGDALGVYPKNCPELVQLLLDALGATGAEAVILPDGRRMTARAALLTEFVITECNDQLIALLGRSASDAGEAKRLHALRETNGDSLLERHDVLDLLQQYPSARPAVREIVATLQPLQPRLYSISSSPLAHPAEVHVTVGVVRYNKQGCGRVRKGVASTFLAERVRPGEHVRIFVQRAHSFSLPSDGAVPIIMVGPGTGVAPFRAFLQERCAVQAKGPNWLFFGDQRQQSDFLYRDEMEEFRRKGVLTHLDTAFSRDQEDKVYVQHRMLEQAPRIWQWLEQGAHVYVCGDAQRMARDVDATLHRIVAEQGGHSEADAKAFMRGLHRSKRYQRDVY
ncbi:MAG: hypothetical protein NVS4B8_12910 [Herpetosiphon sp.]